MKRGLILIMILSACTPILGSERVRAPAEIAGYNMDDPRIDVGVMGRAIHVSVVSYGDGCFSKGETEVRVSGRTVDILPYDYREARGTCPGILLSFTHEASVPFATPGAVTIRVHGRHRGAAEVGDVVSGAVTFERVVQIP